MLLDAGGCFPCLECVLMSIFGRNTLNMRKKGCQASLTSSLDLEMFYFASAQVYTIWFSILKMWRNSGSAADSGIGIYSMLGLYIRNALLRNYIYLILEVVQVTVSIGLAWGNSTGFTKKSSWGQGRKSSSVVVPDSKVVKARISITFWQVWI